MGLLILGLGNPGLEFSLTRHNVGFSLLDKIVSKKGLSLKRKKKYEYAELRVISRRVILVKPLTYMNLSGSIFPSIFSDFYMCIKNLLVVLDNIDLPLGKCRLRERGGVSTHNGIKSISNVLGSSDYNRLYIGVGSNVMCDIKSFVLSRFCKDEIDRLEKLYNFLSDELLDITEANFKNKVQKINSSNF
ncbi:aminoacyl-tRNA hydrolase [Borreliella yangtzensis]|uniref:Peptidyl-tRNA hydrolase n=1 Tax=Borreliella yangtzensis TaxID=683292 RepID=A0ABR6P918_9SPIR|nr:aminoacyl-tRNA hydrolase [Borreliella yangtzensis]MBB6042768.1 PTH1 family peptidyl-tRNA hydrolase [Borreliella yangtzensis]WKC73724.1 aminoacyl-tRNA hydrolase [Borreliella yangtzensis]WKC74640.1 aminoacyl-tRNA hydrolase [Borreliella yangtzensis]